AATVTQHHVPSSRAATGIDGLAPGPGGGPLRDRTYLVEGAPGAGKTTLGLQFSMAGARNDERVLFLTTGESHEELHQIAESHGWSRWCHRALLPRARRR